MNVAELIEKLQRYPPDTLVMLRDWDYVALTAQSVADIPLRKLEYEGRTWGECWDDPYHDRGEKVQASTEPVVGVLIS